MSEKKYRTAPEDEEKLIDLIKQNPCLFDIHHEHYYNNFKKDQIWSDIAKALQRTVPDCKTKWKSIRDTRTRRMRKRGVDSGANFKKSDDDPLNFLDDFTIERRRKSYNLNWTNEGSKGSSGEPTDDNGHFVYVKLENNVEAEVSENDECNLERMSCDIQEGEGHKVPFAVTQAEFSKKTAADRFEERGETMEAASSSQHATRNHPVQAFFDAMAVTVMTFPPHLITETKRRVSEIVWEMEMKVLRESSS